jgi:hypothetical protein
MIKYQNQIDRLSETSPNVLEKIAREGKVDGKKNQPNSKSKNSDFENKLSYEMTDVFQKFKSETDNFIKKTDKKISTNISKIENKLKVSIDNQNRKFDQKVTDLEKTDGEGSHKYSDLINKISENEIYLKSLKTQLEDRELQVALVKTYLPFMIILSFAEVWINRLAFELFFESNPLISFILALAVGGVLVFFAHVCGTTVKRINFSKWNKSLSIFFLALLNSLTLVVIIYLAKMRQAFVAISTLSTEDITFDDLISDDLGDLSGIITEGSAVDNLISTDIGQEGMFLLLINVTIFVCGCIAAFIRHDQHPDYEKLINENKGLLSQRSKYLDKFNHKFSKERKELDTKVNSLNKQIIDIENENEKLNDDISNAKESLEESIEKLKSTYISKVNAYRISNTKERSTPPPEFFNSEPHLGLSNE